MAISAKIYPGQGSLGGHGTRLKNALSQFDSEPWHHPTLCDPPTSEEVELGVSSEAFLTFRSLGGGGSEGGLRFVRW